MSRREDRPKKARTVVPFRRPDRPADTPFAELARTIVGRSKGALIPCPPSVQPLLACFGEDPQAPSIDFVARLVEHELLLREFERRQRESIAALPPHRRASQLADLEMFLDPHGLRKRADPC